MQANQQSRRAKAALRLNSGLNGKNYVIDYLFPTLAARQKMAYVLRVL